METGRPPGACRGDIAENDGSGVGDATAGEPCVEGIWNSPGPVVGGNEPAAGDIMKSEDGIPVLKSGNVADEG